MGPARQTRAIYYLQEKLSLRCGDDDSAEVVGRSTLSRGGVERLSIPFAKDLRDDQPGEDGPMVNGEVLLYPKITSVKSTL